MNREQILEELNRKPEMIPDEHDGSYELMREIISSYSKVSSLDECGYRDLNAIYAMAIGTWKLNVEKKKEYIDKTVLPEEEKQRLASVLDKVWNNTCRKLYSNCETENKPSIGMFGTGFYSFEKDTDDKDIRLFIKALVDISNMEDDDEMFNVVEAALDRPFKGLKAASASVILHCLKPMTFPILNSNAGHGTIYSKLGIELDKPRENTTYISNCRKIKSFRDKYLSFKNYRILDIEAWDFEEDDKQESEVTDMGYAKNTILYGPPGTGKTYNSVRYAVAICDGLSENDIPEYDDALERYNELKKEGRIAFTTFHQSYGYEEFIEGIKPEIDEETQQVTYSVEDGLFKYFCDRASMPDTYDANHKATVYIVRLNFGDGRSIKEECFKNNEIRFDWPEDCDHDWLKWLENMKPGDFVLSYHSASQYIDGVGIVRDEESVYDESLKDFRWKRDVEWIIKDDKIDAMEMNNGKYLSNYHVGRLPGFRVNDLLALINSRSGNKVSVPSKPYVFIIDEINRGNISKIFGELITLIETTKRVGADEEMRATLPYSHQVFGVPDNVYILGTMNTADRSIALMDTALRRRFSFVEKMPESKVLKDIGADKVENKGRTLDVAKMLEVINSRIEYLYDREHTIGHAFFTALKDDNSLEKLAEIFRKSVLPLLQEYFYEDYEKIQLVLGDNLKTADEYKFILDEELQPQKVFKGNPNIDLPEKKYTIQKDAFENIESYIEIL